LIPYAFIKFFIFEPILVANFWGYEYHNYGVFPNHPPYS
jgi:hypothetical protein